MIIFHAYGILSLCTLCNCSIVETGAGSPLQEIQDAVVPLLDVDMDTVHDHELKPDELECIMGAIKLIELLTACSEDASKAPNGRSWHVDVEEETNPAAVFASLDVSLLTTFTSVDVAHLHIFSLRNIKEFIPDSPPDVLPNFYPGTDLRPVRPWYRCSESEKVCVALLHYCLTGLTGSVQLILYVLFYLFRCLS